MAAAQDLNAIGTERARGALGDDVAVGVANCQKVDDAVAVESDCSRGITAGESIEETGVGRQNGVGCPVGECSPASSAIDIPGVGCKELVHCAGVHHRIELA